MGYTRKRYLCKFEGISPKKEGNSAVGGVVKTSGFRYIRLGTEPQWSRYSCEIMIFFGSIQL
ncbi:hypothetical protein [Methanosarcina sp. DH1]|uniref:hypothetical protein n=1 Tax=Methanosarcina sp. DH1 TaxID=2605695 RepID=UPI001E2DA3C7|nr:hypothetical protein [Methanosarcina sp. DH1]